LQFSIVEEGMILTGRKAPIKPKKNRRRDSAIPASKAAGSKGKKRFGKKGKRR